MTIDHCIDELKGLGVTSIKKYHEENSNGAKVEYYQAFFQNGDIFKLINQIYSKLATPPNELRKTGNAVNIWFESASYNLGIEIICGRAGL